jgi:serine/threonine protein kinase
MPTPLRKKPHSEPIPGYRLLERLGSGGFGEVWKCEAPGGLFKAIKFVRGNPNNLHMGLAPAEEELRAVERIKVIRHPFLLSMDRVEVVGGELLIVTELADKSLSQLYQERRQAGLPGIPRAELLGFLREAAEVLDLLNLQHGLQHLDIKPHNLFLVSNHVKVADFGLVSSLGGSARIELGAITPIYASPEVFLGRISPHSDQYSLAVVYLELLSGTLPFQGRNARQLLMQHTTAEPDLSAVSEADRPLVARALDKEPGRRFPSCLDFIRALRAVRTAPGRMPGDESYAENRAVVMTQAKDADTDRSLTLTPTHGTTQLQKKIPSGLSALEGYRFVDCLATTPLMDVWKAQAPDGRERLVKQMFGVLGERKRLEAALARYQMLLHPALTQHDIAHAEPGRLVLVTDPIESCLRDRFQQCLAQGLPGIPREELLGYLRAAAEALDYLYQQHAIQHLGLNPRSLLLEQGRPVLADFGLAKLLWLPAGQPVAQRNARYAAPELFQRQTSHSSDQYSLAVIFVEMLTGILAIRGHDGTATETQQDLKRLDPGDLAILARALDPDPQQRWASCTDLVRALAKEKPDAPEESADHFSMRVNALPRSAEAEAPDQPLGEIIGQLIKSARGTDSAQPAEHAPALSAEEGMLRHQFSAGIPLGTARMKLDSFRLYCEGELTLDEDDQLAFQVSMPARPWKRWLARQPGLEVRVKLTRKNARAATPIDVTVQIGALHCGKKRGIRLLQEVGSTFLESVRGALVVGAEKRIQDRLLWPHALRIRALKPDGTPSDPIQGRGKDISQSGIGFYLPHELPSAEVLVELPATAQMGALSVPATLVRAKKCADGWYEVGALFRLAALRKTLPELCAPLTAGK